MVAINDAITDGAEDRTRASQVTRVGHRIDEPDYRLIADEKKLSEMLFHGSENGKYYSPSFSGLPLCKEWFWNQSDSLRLSQKNTKRLMKSYNQTVGRNANLVFGATPDRRGLVPEWQESILVETGESIRRLYSNP